MKVRRFIHQPTGHEVYNAFDDGKFRSPHIDQDWTPKQLLSDPDIQIVVYDIADKHLNDTPEGRVQNLVRQYNSYEHKPATLQYRLALQEIKKEIEDIVFQYRLEHYKPISIFLNIYEL